jgi:hypothetical protein
MSEAPAVPGDRPRAHDVWALLLLGLPVLITAVLLIALLPLSQGGSSAADPPVAELTLSGTPQLTAEISLPGDAIAGGIAVGGGSAWVGVQGDKGTGSTLVVRIDLATDRIVADIPVSGIPWRGLIAATDSAVWVASDGVVERIDPSTDEVVARIELGDLSPSTMAVDGSDLWVVAIEDRSDAGGPNVGHLVRVDTETDDIVATIDVGEDVSGYEDEIIAGDGTVWVLGPRLLDDDIEDGGDLLRIDAGENRVTSSLAVDGFSMVRAPDGIWVRSPVDGLFDGTSPGHASEAWHWVVVDDATNSISEPFVLDAPIDLITTDVIWAAGYDEQERGRVWSLEARTFAVLDTSEPIESLFHQAVVDAESRTVWFSAIDTVFRYDIVP